MKTKLFVSILMLFLAFSFVSATDEPKLVSVTDSLGNIQTNSWAKGTGGDWQGILRDPNNLYCSNCVIKIGDKITFTITADQENLEYKCYDGATGNTFRDWSTSNTCEWIVQREDYGQSSGIILWIRNDNGLEYEGLGHGDDYTYMTYKVVEGNDSITNSSNNTGTIVEGVASCSNSYSCNDWSSCVNGQQTRTCSYSGNCEAQGGEKPIETQTCVVSIQTNVSVGGEVIPVNYSVGEQIPVTAIAVEPTGHINLTEACNGCLTGETCVSFGYRINNTYCDLSKNFLSQKVEETDCNNSFECESNVCASGKCVSASLITRILNWFRHLFGLG